MTDTQPFALLALLAAAAGLVAVLSSRLTEGVKVPSPALVLHRKLAAAFEGH